MLVVFSGVIAIVFPFDKISEIPGAEIYGVPTTERGNTLNEMLMELIEYFFNVEYDEYSSRHISKILLLLIVLFRTI